MASPWGARGRTTSRRRAQTQERGTVNETRREETQARLAFTNCGLESLGEMQKQALIDVVLRMGDFLRRHDGRFGRANASWSMASTPP